MVIYAVITVVFAIGFVLAPGQMLSIYGVEPDAPSRLIGQFFGAVLISLALLTWLARGFGNSEARRAIVLALLAGETVGLIVALMGQLNGVLNVLGWSAVAVYLFFALGLAYFQFGRSAS
jgi:uncharacterized membrane protein